MRVVLFGMFRVNTPAPGDTMRAMLIGLHLDVTAATCLLFPFLLWCCVIPNSWFGAKWHRTLMSCGALLFWIVEVFLLLGVFLFRRV